MPSYYESWGGNEKQTGATRQKKAPGGNGYTVEHGLAVQFGNMGSAQTVKSICGRGNIGGKDLRMGTHVYPDSDFIIG